MDRIYIIAQRQITAKVMGETNVKLLTQNPKISLTSDDVSWLAIASQMRSTSTLGCITAGRLFLMIIGRATHIQDRHKIKCVCAKDVMESRPFKLVCMHFASDLLCLLC
eukprot:813497_1